MDNTIQNNGTVSQETVQANPGQEFPNRYQETRDPRLRTAGEIEADDRDMRLNAVEAWIAEYEPVLTELKSVSDIATEHKTSLGFALSKIAKLILGWKI
jgi:hypothetical protein